MQILLSCAFRAFFLLGPVMAIAVIVLWSLAILGFGPVVGYPNLIYWHAHEMVFGFVAAIVAGFALTAVAVWTGRPRLQGAVLGWLVAAWLIGRVAMIFGHEWPAAVVTTADMLFLALFACLFGREVMAGGNWRNFPIVIIVVTLALLNLLFHLASGTNDRVALLLAVHVVLTLVAIISGRIIPSFTTNWLKQRGRSEDSFPRSTLIIDIAAVVLTAATGIAVTFAPYSPLSGIIAFVAAGVHAVRLGRWSGLATVGEPLLFVMHIAYAWFPIGYVLTGAAVFGGYMPTVALHALTIGVLGGMILAMISRVPLGHTGRPLHASRVTVVAYVLWMLTVVTRLSGPFLGDWYVKTVETAASIWMIVFALFLWAYWPVLSKPEIE